MPKYKLEDVAEEIRLSTKNIGRNTPIVGLEHLDPESLTLKRWEINVPTTFSRAYFEGDILFGRRRAYLRKAALAPNSGVCSGDITVIRVKKGKIYEPILPFIIQNQAFFDFAVKNSDGSLSPRVKWQHLKEFSFFLPSLEKQKELANLLLALENAKSAYQNSLQAIDSYLISSVNLAESDFTVELGSIIQIMPKSKIKAGEAVKDGQFPFFSSSENHDQRIDKYSYDDELIILGTGGATSINYFNGKFAVSTDNFSFKSKSTEFLTKYIYYYLKANRDIVELGFKGSGMKHLSKDYLNKIKIKHIQKKEQEKFLLLCDKLEETQSLIYEQLARINVMRKSLLDNIFNGGLD